MKPSSPPSDVGSDNSKAIIEHHPIIIVGGGIGGLVLALCLDQVYNHPTDSSPPSTPLPIHVYESTTAYTANAGGAIGLYSNGLRVLRHLSKHHPELHNILNNVRTAGCEYLYRRWMRHDGVEVAVAREDELLPDITIHENGIEEENEGIQKDDDESVDTNSTAASSGQRSPRGDSIAIASHDKERERADRRSRGGSFGSLRTLLGATGSSTRSLQQRPRGNSISSQDKTTISQEKNDSGNDSDGGNEESTNSLIEMFQTLTGGGGSKDEKQSTDEAKEGTQRRRSIGHLAYEALAQLAPTSRTSGASARTSGLSTSSNRSPHMVETELLSLGIRRWKYQQILYDACVAAGVHIHFGKRLQSVTSISSGDEGDSKTLLHFKDGSQATTSLLIGADGINSKVRNYVTNPQNEPKEEYVPEYTGVTCLMGCANVPRIRGICFPSSATTKCHACYYPTRAPREGTDDDPSDYEQVFQIFFPSPIERQDTWRTLTPQEAKEECRELAQKLRKDGWAEQFLKPLESPTLTGVLRVGLRSREGLDCWHVGGNSTIEGEGAEGDTAKRAGRAVLLGDAAHPPVPYIGQGAMMAMEDAGTLSMILGHFCPIAKSDAEGEAALPDFSQFAKAIEVYESLRVPRTKAILGASVALGETQQKRAESKLYNAWREISIKAQVWAYGTLPVMKPGAAFDYRTKVEEALAEEEKGECEGVQELNRLVVGLSNAM